jgi:hypothetical protein
MKSQSLCEDSDLIYFFHIPSKNSSKDNSRVSVVHAIICESDPARLDGGGDSPALNKKKSYVNVVLLVMNILSHCFVHT